jgi:hypothetical protein
LGLRFSYLNIQPELSKYSFLIETAPSAVTYAVLTFEQKCFNLKHVFITALEIITRIPTPLYYQQEGVWESPSVKTIKRSYNTLKDFGLDKTTVEWTMRYSIVLKRLPFMIKEALLLPSAITEGINNNTLEKLFKDRKVQTSESRADWREIKVEREVWRSFGDISLGFSSWLSKQRHT